MIHAARGRLESGGGRGERRPRLLEMGDVYRLDGRQKFVSIVVPSTLPY